MEEDGKKGQVKKIRRESKNKERNKLSTSTKE
jgi:hypothetical protein